MSKPYISRKDRRAVFIRAKNRCEYCQCRSDISTGHESRTITKIVILKISKFRAVARFLEIIQNLQICKYLIISLDINDLNSWRF